jgi:hypothetical protein
MAVLLLANKLLDRIALKFFVLVSPVHCRPVHLIIFTAQIGTYCTLEPFIVLRRSTWDTEVCGYHIQLSRLVTYWVGIS